jgi:hypothetical protein
VRQHDHKAVLAVSRVAARLRDAGLAIQVCELHNDQCALRAILWIFRVDMNRQRFCLSLLAGPAGNKEMIAILADAVDVADDTTNGSICHGRCQRRKK